MKSKKSKSSLMKSFLKNNYIPIIIGLLFLIGYLLLSLIKHYTFLSGYDLSVIDQAIWKYSRFKIPITTTHVYYDTPVYFDHFEIIFLLIAPLYWIFNTVVTLIVLQVISVVASGVAVLLLAKHYGLKNFVANSLFLSYLAFFGIQFAIWSDVHSLVFGVAFLSWFLYFLETKRIRLTILFLFLSIFCKEDIALLTFLISFVYFIFNRTKLPIIACVISTAYLGFLFLVYFPHIIGVYRFANPNGLLSDVNPYYFINTSEKQQTILYSLGSFGFIPLLVPLYIIPFVADLAHYFVLGNAVVTSAQGLFAHYRSSVGLLLVWPTIIAISKYKFLNNWKVGIYLIICAAFFQYYLHLPLSYLTKKWFWTFPPEASNIYKMLKTIPSDASIVTQNNIAVHITHRDQVYILFPNVADFPKNSPCGIKSCRWFRVGGSPELLLIDTGNTWNILHYLSTPAEFNESISNLEKNGNIILLSQKGTTKLYKIVKKI